MTDIVQADIFFFLSSILLTLLTVVLVVVFVYIIKILKDARSIVAVVKRETESLAEDMENVRERIRENGFSVKTLSFIAALFKKGRGRKGRK